MQNYGAEAQNYHKETKFMQEKNAEWPQRDTKQLQRESKEVFFVCLILCLAPMLKEWRDR